MEWKVLKIDYLDIPTVETIYHKKQADKALKLSYFDKERVTRLRFVNDSFGRNGLTIQQWVEVGGPRQQLQEYSKSETIMALSKEYKDLDAYLIVIVGSRKILLWKIGIDGTIVSGPELVNYK
jgi:hypothetical protein